MLTKQVSPRNKANYSLTTSHEASKIIIISMRWLIIIYIFFWSRCGWSWVGLLCVCIGSLTVVVLLVLLVSSALAHFPIRCVPFPEGTESEYCGDSLPSTTCVRDFGDENLRFVYWMMLLAFKWPDLYSEGMLVSIMKNNSSIWTARCLSSLNAKLILILFLDILQQNHCVFLKHVKRMTWGISANRMHDTKLWAFRTVMPYFFCGIIIQIPENTRMRYLIAV